MEVDDEKAPAEEVIRYLEPEHVQNVDRWYDKIQQVRARITLMMEKLPIPTIRDFLAKNGIFATNEQTCVFMITGHHTQSQPGVFQCDTRVINKATRVFRHTRSGTEITVSRYDDWFMDPFVFSIFPEQLLDRNPAMHPDMDFYLLRRFAHTHGLTPPEYPNDQRFAVVDHQPIGAIAPRITRKNGDIVPRVIQKHFVVLTPMAMDKAYMACPSHLLQRFDRVEAGKHVFTRTVYLRPRRIQTIGSDDFHLIIGHQPPGRLTNRYMFEEHGPELPESAREEIKIPDTIGAVTEPTENQMRTVAFCVNPTPIRDLVAYRVIEIDHLRFYIFATRIVCIEVDAYNPCGGVIANGLGTGKTYATLLACALALDGYKMPSIVICPPTLVKHWEAEIAKHFPKHVDNFAILNRKADLGTIANQGLCSFPEHARNKVSVVNQNILARIDPRTFPDVYHLFVEEAHRLKSEKAINAMAQITRLATWLITATPYGLRNIAILLSGDRVRRVIYDDADYENFYKRCTIMCEMQRKIEVEEVIEWVPMHETQVDFYNRLSRNVRGRVLDDPHVRLNRIFRLLERLGAEGPLAPGLIMDMIEAEIGRPERIRREREQQRRQERAMYGYHAPAAPRRTIVSKDALVPAPETAIQDKHEGCPVCLDRFLYTAQFPCRHVVCYSCYEGIQATPSKGMCPMCRGPFADKVYKANWGNEKANGKRKASPDSPVVDDPIEPHATREAQEQADFEFAMALSRDEQKTKRQKTDEENAMELADLEFARRLQAEINGDAIPPPLAAPAPPVPPPVIPQAAPAPPVPPPAPVAFDYHALRNGREQADVAGFVDIRQKATAFTNRAIRWRDRVGEYKENRADHIVVFMKERNPAAAFRQSLDELGITYTVAGLGVCRQDSLANIESFKSGTYSFLLISTYYCDGFDLFIAGEVWLVNTDINNAKDKQAFGRAHRLSQKSDKIREVYFLQRGAFDHFMYENKHIGNFVDNAHETLRIFDVWFSERHAVFRRCLLELSEVVRAVSDSYFSVELSCKADDDSDLKLTYDTEHQRFREFDDTGYRYPVTVAAIKRVLKLE